MKKIFWTFSLILGLMLAWVVPGFAPGRGAQDFIRYWAASRLLISGGNPYDSRELTALQKNTPSQLTIEEGDIVEAWNPPWLLLTLAPLGFFSLHFAIPLWVLMNILSIMTGLLMSWRFSGGEQNPRFFLIAIGAGFLFGNTIILIRLGQITTLILISLLVGFLLIEKKQDWLAGGVLLITTIKPHLTFLVLFVLLLWVFKHRRWKILAGMAAAGLLSALIVWLILPNWLSIYFQTIQRLPFSNIFTSTLGSFMSEVLGIHFFKYSAILLLPIAFLLVNEWEQRGWFSMMNISLVLTIPFSFYGFSFDQVLLLPSVVQTIVWITQGKLPRLLSLKLVFGFLLTYGFLLFMMSIRSLPYYWYFWVSFSIFCLYILAWNFIRKEKRLA